MKRNPLSVGALIGSRLQEVVSPNLAFYMTPVDGPAREMPPANLAGALIGSRHPEVIVLAIRLRAGNLQATEALFW